LSVTILAAVPQYLLN